MGVLRIATILMSVCLVSVAIADDFLPMLDGTDLSLTGGVGTGSNDYFGVGGTFYMGEDLDPKNITGDFHFNYSANFAPEDSTVDNSPLKRLTNWSGGFSVDPWSHGSLGFDFDSSSDPFEQLATEGLRVSLDQGPAGISYRIARTTLQTPFQVDPTNPKKSPTDFLGAFIYQQTLGFGLHEKFGKSDFLSASGAVSFFNPDAADFATLLNADSLATLGNLQSELQNFERWNAGSSWRHKYNDRWDSRVSGQFSHLVVGENPLVIATASGGYHWTHDFLTRLGIQYLYTPGEPITTVIFEARWSWIREREGE
jgi:hypothetical protein